MAAYLSPTATTDWTWNESPTATRYYYTRWSEPITWRFIPPLPAIPKNWRWWHALARWATVEPRVVSRPPEPPVRALYGFPLGERRRRKRRHFVQRLAA